MTENNITVCFFDLPLIIFCICALHRGAVPPGARFDPIGPGGMRGGYVNNVSLRADYASNGLLRTEYVKTVSVGADYANGLIKTEYVKNLLTRSRYPIIYFQSWYANNECRMCW